MKYAIRITESLSRTVIVEADSYDDGVNKLEMAHDDNKITVTPDNAFVEISYTNETENFIDAYGKTEFFLIPYDII